MPRVSDALEPFADMPPVFATAFMIAHVEATCIACVRDHLGEGEHTVGTHVDVSYTAATPVGLDVTASVKLTEVVGRSLTFRVEVHDSTGAVGAGTHRRAVIDVERFMAKVVERGGGKAGERPGSGRCG